MGRDFKGRNVVVIGATGAVGSEVVRAASAQGASVLGVARSEGPLNQLAAGFPGMRHLVADATLEQTPEAVFDELRPDLLVLAAGAMPMAAPVHELGWKEFCLNWNSDVKMTFLFLQAALTRPLAAGTTVVVLSSGAAVAGSPHSGGYAGAKRTQAFLVNYAQKESDRLGRGLRIVALAPRMMPGTPLGAHAVAGYARYVGLTAADFVRSMHAPPTASQVAAIVLSTGADPEAHVGRTLIVDGAGIQPIPS